MTKLKLAFEIAKFILFVVTALKTLVINAEERLPESGHGKEKFAAVKKAIVLAAAYAGIAREAIEAADDFLNREIDATVASEINNER